MKSKRKHTPNRNVAEKPVKRAMTMRELCEYTGLSESYFRHALNEGPRANRLAPPPVIRLGKCLRFLKDDVDTWLEKNRANDQQKLKIT